MKTPGVPASSRWSAAPGRVEVMAEPPLVLGQSRGDQSLADSHQESREQPQRDGRDFGDTSQTLSLGYRKENRLAQVTFLGPGSDGSPSREGEGLAGGHSVL